MAKAPRGVSRRGLCMLPVARLMFKKMSFNDTCDREYFEDILLKAGRKPPTRSKAPRDWANNERKMLNQLGDNYDLLEIHNIEPFVLECQRNDVGGGEMTTLDLRRPEISLIVRNHFNRVVESGQAATIRISSRSQSIPAGDKRWVLERNIMKVMALISRLALENEKDQVRLIKQFPR